MGLRQGSRDKTTQTSAYKIVTAMKKTLKKSERNLGPCVLRSMYKHSAAICKEIFAVRDALNKTPLRGKGF